MVDPSYDLSCMDKELLCFLKYTHSGHQSDDIIPLALAQMFRNAMFIDIILEEEEIHSTFVSYESPDGIVHPIMKGQCANFVLASLYAWYCFAQYKTQDPDKWTKDEFFE